jgi:hypothetical protein
VTSIAGRAAEMQEAKKLKSLATAVTRRVRLLLRSSSEFETTRLKNLETSTLSEKRKEKIMNTRKVVLTGLVVFALAVASLAQQVKTDYDRDANFSNYKTFSFEKIQTKDPLLVDRIKSAVSGALTAKGLSQVESGGDISVVAVEMTNTQQRLDTFYNGFGGGWRFGGRFGDATTTTETYQVGTLVVDMFDSQSKELLWRGSASNTLSNKSNTNIKNLDKGVQKMFKKYPPKA